MRPSRPVARCFWAVVGIWAASPCPGQATVPPPSQASPPFEGRAAADLATRYRLIEAYSPADARERPELIGPYRVAIRETIRTVIDNPRGAPTRREVGAQILYEERPAQVDDRDAATAVIRRYETFRLTPDVQARPSATRPLEGLTIWYQPRPEKAPMVLSLTEKRRLRDEEYTVISRSIFLPELASVLAPGLPHRIGEPWMLAPAAVKALTGQAPPPRTSRPTGLAATLQEIRDDPKRGRRIAVIHASGRVLFPDAETAVNAQLLFAFAPAGDAEKAQEKEKADEPEKKTEPKVIEARGAIVELRMAVAKTFGLPPDGRNKQTRTNELILGRQLSTGAGAPTLAVPQPPPTPTEANSWLTYTDPRARFHFQHPQELLSQPSEPGEDTVALLDPQPGGPDVVTIDILPKTDPRIRDPEYHRKKLKEEQVKRHLPQTEGASGWLPEADWAASKMKVYRMETRIDPDERGQRRPQPIFTDYYLVLLSRNETLWVESRTVRDQPTAFGKTVEAILRTFRFDTPEAAGR